MRSGVVCSGSVVLDIVVRAVERIAWGTTTLVESIGRHLGANGANTAYALAFSARVCPAGDGGR